MSSGQHSRQAASDRSSGSRLTQRPWRGQGKECDGRLSLPLRKPGRENGCLNYAPLYLKTGTLEYYEYTRVSQCF